MSKDDLAVVRNRKIGFVFQGFNLLSRTTALDNVELPLLYNGGSKMKLAERHKRAMDALTAVGLGERYHHYPEPALGRAAAARRDRARADQRAVDHPRRRADRQPRHAHQHRGHGHLPAAQHRARHHHHPDHARNGHRRVRHAARAVPRREDSGRPDQITNRRDAAKELAALPPPEEIDPHTVQADPASADHHRRGRLGDIMSILMTLRHRAEGAQPQQDAHHADDARDDHRRRRRDHDGRARPRRAGDHRGAGQGGRHQHDQHQRRQLLAGRRSSGPGQLDDPHARTTRRRFAQLPGVQYVAAGVNSRAQVIAGNQNWSTQIQGTDVDFPLIRSWPTKYGVVLHAAGRQQRGEGRGARHGRRRTRCSATDVDPTGQIIRIRNQPFKVIGVMSSKGTGAMGNDQDDVIFAPYTTVQKKLQGIQHINNITVSAETRRHRPGCRGDRADAASSPQAHRQRSGRLHGPHPGRNGQRPHRDDQDDDDPAGRRSPACRSSSAASGS